MKEDHRIRAKTGPGDPVFPPVDGWLGILMLDTRFPRPPGDVGHPATFSPARQLVVGGSFPAQVVASAASLRSGGMASLFQAALRRLEKDGAAAVTTSCGFLVLLQSELQACVSIPVLSSSLLLLPDLLDQERQVGVLTISSHLGREHLEAAGVSASRIQDVLVHPVPPSSEFASAIMGNRIAMDIEQAALDVVQAAQALCLRAPALRTLVLECTNMPPYTRQIEEATGLRVLSLRDVPGLRRWVANDGPTHAGIPQLPRTSSASIGREP